MSSVAALSAVLVVAAAAFSPDGPLAVAGPAPLNPSMLHGARILRREEPASAFTQSAAHPQDTRPDGIYPVKQQLQATPLRDVERHDRNAPSGSDASAPAEAFDLLDRDRDGEISRQEFRTLEAAVKHQEESQMAAQAEAVFTPVVVVAQERPVVQALVEDDGPFPVDQDGGRWQLAELPSFEELPSSLLETPKSHVVLEDELEKAASLEASVPEEISLDEVASREDDDPDDVTDNEDEDDEDRKRMQTEGHPYDETSSETVVQESD